MIYLAWFLAVIIFITNIVIGYEAQKMSEQLPKTMRANFIRQYGSKHNNPTRIIIFWVSVAYIVYYYFGA